MKRRSATSRTGSLRAVILAVTLASLLTPPAAAQFQVELHAAGAPDECFDGVGNPYPPLIDGACPEGGIPKTNQSYGFSLALVDANHDGEADSVWIGTVANYLCIVAAGLGTDIAGLDLGEVVCEGDQSQLAQSDPTLGDLGDWRSPRVYELIVSTNELIERTTEDPIFADTIGWRSAMTLDGVVLLLGPNREQSATTGGTALSAVAYRASDGTFLGSTQFPQYNDSRKAVVVDGVAYIGVGRTSGSGTVLRWVGDEQSPFEFIEVGNTPKSKPANLTLHDGRLLATTWPNPPNDAFPIPYVNTEPGGLYTSPLIPQGGLTAVHADAWQRLWGYEEYDADALIAAVGAGGDIASFAGWAWWGTMHVPGSGLLPVAAVLGDALDDPAQLALAVVGSHRATAVFRGRNFGTPDQEIQLLYGERMLPKLSILTGTWRLAFTGMGRPRFGGSGLDNILNGYVWAAAVLPDPNDRHGDEGDLLMGTLDMSSVVAALLSDEIAALPGDAPDFMVERATAMMQGGVGADVWRFRNNWSRAWPLSLDGLGNIFNYGIRNLRADDSGVWASTANPFNTAPDDAGGWELYRIERSDQE